MRVLDGMPRLLTLLAAPTSLQAHELHLGFFVIFAAFAYPVSSTMTHVFYFLV